MMGISTALYKEIVVVDSQFSASNYHRYPMAVLMDTPIEVNIILMEGDEKPSGVGKPHMGPIAPAIATRFLMPPNNGREKRPYRRRWPRPDG